MIAVKEHPIIFSTNIVRAILDDKCLQTRRTRGLDEINEFPDSWERIGYDQSGRFSFRWIGGDRILNVRCPYGQVGDRLWVRETWATEKRLNHLSGKELGKASDVALWYKANEIPSVSLERGRWRSSRFMPRWASRITLEITEVRVERVQEISGADIEAEGISPEYGIGYPKGTIIFVYEFVKLWDSLNAKRGYGWEVNPWVWVISFKVVK